MSESDLIVDKHDASHCPICHRKWLLVEETEKSGKAYFVCLFCEISIWVRDKMLGKYFQAPPEPCPRCGTNFRQFYRSDQYVLLECPKCKVRIESVDEQKHKAVMAEEVKRGIRWLPPKDAKPKEIIDGT